MCAVGVMDNMTACLQNERVHSWRAWQNALLRCRLMQFMRLIYIVHAIRQRQSQIQKV